MCVSLVQMSFLGSFLILCILIIRTLLIHKLPKTAFLVLWEIAALRLLMPFSIALPFQLLPTDMIEVAMAEAIAPNGVNEITAPAIFGPAEQSGIHPSIFSVLWTVGAIALAAWFLIVYVRNLQKFKRSLPDKTPQIEKWLTEHPHMCSIEVRVSDQIDFSLIHGVFHPVILLPKGMNRTNPDILYTVLEHEYVHISRLDGAAKLLFAAAFCLHWWNPLVWIMYILASQDMELSCDAAVIRSLGIEYRSTYALALISMEEERSRDVSLQSHFSKNAIAERIEAIMKLKKSSVAVIVVAVVIVLVAVLFLMTGSFSEKRAADYLENSIRYENGVVSFTIPEEYEHSENWNIYISGRKEFSDGMSMSDHLFEDINEAHMWERGKEYTIDTNGQNYTNLTMDIFF